MAVILQVGQRGPTGPPTRELAFSTVSLAIGLVYVAATVGALGATG